MNIARMLLTGGTALVMYLYLPILDIVEIVFILALGVIWLFLLADLILTMFGVFDDISQGFSERARVAVEAGRAKVKAAREDFADRVESKVQATA